MQRKDRDRCKGKTDWEEVIAADGVEHRATPKVCIFTCKRGRATQTTRWELTLLYLGVKEDKCKETLRLGMGLHSSAPFQIGV